MRFSERMEMAHAMLTLLRRQIDPIERSKWGNELIERTSMELGWDQGWDALTHDMAETLDWMLANHIDPRRGRAG